MVYSFQKGVNALEIFERVRELRKNHLKLSQETFGARLGVSRSVIKNMELDVLARPEQKEPLYRLICKTFNVSYDWLTAGQGEMYTETKETFLEKLSSEYGLSFTAQKIIECYLNLDESQRGTVDEFIKSVAESIVDAPAESKDTEAEIVDEAISRIDYYRAADSKEHTEHEIIKDGQGTIQKLKNLPKVTDKENF